jgi:NAD(P)-dependent dehydrogenase (short-subunit alcohol dehydrogenase family)
MASVLITGTSTGIGLVTTVELAKRGWRVFATMRDMRKAHELEDALKGAGVRGLVDIVQLDVTDAASIRTAVTKVLSLSGGKLDAVVNNAGMSVAGAFEDLPDPDVRRVMETNFFGVLALTRALLPTLRAQRHGRILIVSSEAAFFGLPANSIYSASKWAIEGWAESLTYDLAPFGIEVILVEPGPYKTSIWQTTPRIRPADSAYRLLMHQMSNAADMHAATTARDPVEVGVKIAKALEANRPRFRYTVGPMAAFNHFARGKLPSRLMRWLVTRYLGLHRVKL